MKSIPAILRFLTASVSLGVTLRLIHTNFLSEESFLTSDLRLIFKTLASDLATTCAFLIF
jgi:phosphoenolpyruvate carboxylase